MRLEASYMLQRCPPRSYIQSCIPVILCRILAAKIDKPCTCFVFLKNENMRATLEIRALMFLVLQSRPHAGTLCRRPAIASAAAGRPSWRATRPVSRTFFLMYIFMYLVFICVCMYAWVLLRASFWTVFLLLLSHAFYRCFDVFECVVCMATGSIYSQKIRCYIHMSAALCMHNSSCGHAHRACICMAYVLYSSLMYFPPVHAYTCI
jgi:hypothetical protein